MQQTAHIHMCNAAVTIHRVCLVKNACYVQYRCKVTEECFAHMTAMLQPVAPLAVLLEGGYNLSATAAATEACLRVLLGERPPALPFEDRAPSASGLAVIQHVIRTQVHQAYQQPAGSRLPLLCCPDAMFYLLSL